MTEQTAGFIALIIVYVGGYLIQWARGRSKAQTVTDTAETVRGQQAVIENLQNEYNKLTHIKALYDTLHESHELLQADHKTLKETVSKLTGKITALETELDTERTTRHSVELHNGELQKALAASELRCHDLEVANNELRQVAAMLKPLTDLVRDMVSKTETEAAAPGEPEGANIVPGENVTHE